MYLKMEETNPLALSPIIPPKKCGQSNARGRPTSEKATKFTPQPKSIVSRLLRRVRKPKSNNFTKVNTYGIQNISKSICCTENDFKSKNEVENLHLTNACQNIQENYTVELEDAQDNFKNGLDAEEQNNIQSNNTTLWHMKCEEPKLVEIACYVCSHRSSSQQAHRKHLRIHRNQPYACNFPQCTYSCKLSCNLIKHKRIHTSEKPFLCDQCTFRSNFANSLKVHKRIHTSERPYGCQLCSYRCNSSSNLKKHCRHKHPSIS